MCKDCFAQKSLHKFAFDKVCGYICERYFDENKIILSLKPWVEGSKFSVYDVSESVRHFWIRLRTSEGSDFKLKFEDRNRKHKYKVAELIENYFKDQNVKKMVFTLVMAFKDKGLIGKKDGFLSKTAFTLMILTWLISEGYLAQAQPP